jgi:hypothetical protein
MMELVGGSLAAAAVGGATWAMARRVGSRRQHYHSLAAMRAEAIRGRDPQLNALPPSETLKAAFRREPIIRVGEFLDAPSLDRLRDEALSVADRVKRSYIPTHKKGGTVSYEDLHRRCPHCLAFYHGPVVQDWVSALVEQPVGPAGDHDQSANSLLFYTEAGDHIHWHYDHNFYRGRQFTALLNLVNRGPDGRLSASTLAYKSANGDEITVDTRENSFVVFEGARVRHQATPTAAGDLRVMLSMTYNTDARISVVGEALRRVKDTAFFGLRVLWA